MRYATHTPPGPLGEFVENFWMCSDAAVPHGRERIVPSGTVELVFNLCEDEVRIYDPEDSTRLRRFAGAVVSGTYAGAFAIDPCQHAAIVGVHFKPGGASRILGAAAGEFAGTHLDLQCLWGAAAVELRERLCALTTPQERFELLTGALTDRLRAARRRDAAVPTALRLFGTTGTGVSTREVAHRVGLSQRRFIQTFTSEVGLTPKLFCRVLRFQRVLSLVSRCATPGWARLAAGCGYFDQSHLIRDFVEFTGLRPTEYLRQKSDRVLRNHVPIAAAGQFSPIPGTPCGHRIDDRARDAGPARS